MKKIAIGKIMLQNLLIRLAVSQFPPNSKNSKTQNNKCSKSQRIAPVQKFAPNPAGLRLGVMLHRILKRKARG